MAKPRLVFFDQLWFCQAEDELAGVGVGESIHSAYADWLDQRRMSILHARCVGAWLAEEQSTTFH